MTKPALALVLVGHGTAARDTPPELLRELRALGRERERSGLAMSERERALDRQVRRWPRSPATDPYGRGVGMLAEALRAQLPSTRVVTAFNELSHPSTDEAIDKLIADGFRRVLLVSTMLTPGGRHSEIDIPKTVVEARLRHPSAAIEYLWPFDIDLLAGCLAAAVSQHLRE